MTQINTYLNIIDNSGIKLVKCLGYAYKKKSIKIQIGDSFLGSIKKLRTKYKVNKLKKGDLVRCLVVQNKIQKKNSNNILYTFFNNYAIVLNEQNLPIGTRIFCSILAEPFRIKKLYRILTIAKKVI
jgi:large subunit ribosomal protein L14